MKKKWKFQLQYQLHPHPPPPQEYQEGWDSQEEQTKQDSEDPRGLRTPHRMRTPRMLKMTRTPWTPLTEMTGNRVQGPLSVNENLQKRKVADKNTVNKLLCLLWIAVLKLGKDNKMIQVHC